MIDDVSDMNNIGDDVHDTIDDNVDLMVIDD